jgi:hypothetical protein
MIPKREPIKRAHSPLLAAGLASVYKVSRVPYGAAKLCRQGEHSPWLAAGSLQFSCDATKKRRALARRQGSVMLVRKTRKSWERKEYAETRPERPIRTLLLSS